MINWLKRIHFLALLLCLAVLGHSQVLQTQTHSKVPIKSTLVTFTSYNKTAGFIMTPDSGATWRVYIDTSASGQAGEYKRIDNTADSGRSNPVLIQFDSTGRYLPTGNIGLVFSTKANGANVDSNGIQFKAYRRWVFPYKANSGQRSTAYSYPGKNGAGMVDTVACSNNGGLANVKMVHYGEITPHGTYVRFRPDRIAATGKVVTDTSKFDSLQVIF